MDERTPAARPFDELDRQNFIAVLGTIVGRLAREASNADVHGSSTGQSGASQSQVSES